MSAVYVVGSINTDVVTYVERLPRAGETVFGSRFSEMAGGKGANQAVAASRSGVSCIMHGAVGGDAFGMTRIRDLAISGVDVSHVTVIPDERSGLALVCVDSNGENQIVVSSGANGAFRLDEEEFCAGVRPNDVVLLQNEIDLNVTTRAIALAHDQGAIVMWNVAPMLKLIGVTERTALEQVDYLIVNEVELAALISRQPCESVTDASLRAVSDLGCAHVLVTLGAQGAVLADRQWIHQQAASDTEVTDTVGAGDCVAGVFAATIALGGEPRVALRRAVAAAGLCVTREGAQQAMPSDEEIRQAEGTF